VTTGVGVMARAPSSIGKTRLAPHLSPDRLRALRSALLVDTLRAVERLPDVFIFFTPDEAEPEIASVAGSAMLRVPQCAGDLGARMLGALRYLLDDRKYEAALLVGSDIPFLTANHVREAAETLQAYGGLVLGPADDGGYYLIGMTQPHAALFDGMPWGSESVLTDTLRTAERIGVEARLVSSAYDVDTVDDLLRLERDLGWAPADVCPAVRRWFTEA
jgi:rSAM/selenodomain-associated transferase 1